MAFPTGWPPRFSSGKRNIRFYIAATATANFSDRAYLFADQVGANPYTPLPDVRPGGDVSSPDYPGPTDIGANPAGTGQHGDDPHPMIWSEGIMILNKGGLPIYFSFDGVNIQGEVPAAAAGVPGQIYMERSEAGIAINGAGNDFVVYAW